MIMKTASFVACLPEDVSIYFLCMQREVIAIFPGRYFHQNNFRYLYVPKDCKVQCSLQGKDRNVQGRTYQTDAFRGLGIGLLTGIWAKNYDALHRYPSPIRCAMPPVICKSSLPKFDVLFNAKPTPRRTRPIHQSSSQVVCNNARSMQPSGTPLCHPIHRSTPTT